jgi:hypothetical protein
MSRRAIILGANPYPADAYKKDAKTLFDDTGGNTGNLAFMYAVANHLRGARILHWGAKREDVRSAGDVIVLALANQLGNHTDLGSAAARLEEFDLPVVGVGLGAQARNDAENVTLTPGTRRWLQTIARLKPADAPNIGVRGRYTETQVAKLGLPGVAAVTGCPSNFINVTEDIAARIAAGFKRRPRIIGVTAGIPHSTDLANIERDLADIATHTGGAYIVQHGLQMLRLARNEFDHMPAEELEACRRYIAPYKSLDEFISWCRRYAYAFYDARSWMDFLRRFDFVVGTRFHGAMLAIQAGVPAACIVHDSRTAEMCQTMGIPYRHHTEITGALTQHNVLDYFSFDADLYRQTRKRLSQQYVELFRAADIELVPGFSLT